MRKLPVLSEVLQQPQYEARHHGLGDAHELGGRGARSREPVAVVAAEPGNGTRGVT